MIFAQWLEFVCHSPGLKPGAQIFTDALTSVFLCVLPKAGPLRLSAFARNVFRFLLRDYFLAKPQSRKECICHIPV